MAFTVQFYTFSKKEKSTAQPSGAGTSVSCFANEALDVLAPTIGLDWQLSGLPTVYNYAYIPDFGRYYFVNNWTNVDGLWIAGLRVDPLASQKTGIGAAQLYVYRAASQFDDTVVDTMYPEINDIRYQSMTVQVPWSSAASSVYGVNFVLGIMGSGYSGVQYRVFTWTQLRNLMDYLMSDSYYVDVLGIFGSSDASAKVAVNPLQYIQSIRAYPTINFAPAAVNNTPDADPVLLTEYYVGPLLLGDSVTIEPGRFNCYEMRYQGVETQVVSSYTDIALVNVPGGVWTGHPQAVARGAWVNARHGKYTLTAPPFGAIPLDPVEVSQADGIRAVVAVDITTGVGQLTLYYYKETTQTREYSGPVIVQAPVGVDIPLTAVTAAGFGTHQIASILSAALPAVIGATVAGPAGAAAGIIGAASNAVGTVTESRIAKGTHIGNQGSLINYKLNTQMLAEYTMLAADDVASLGRPLCQIRQLSDLSGYIKADPDDLALSCTVSEMDEIRAAISGGFYYE